MAVDQDSSLTFSIVLHRPEGSINIGSICRAMKVMNLHSLKIISPAAPINEAEVRKWSLRGFDIFQNAQFYDTLEEATATSILVAGTSRRHGKHRKHFYLSPAEFAEKAYAYPAGNIDIIFGNEQNGLGRHELSLCHFLITIPANEEMGSLNLSHAVQIICYELMAKKVAPKPNRFLPISTAKVEALSLRAVESLTSLGFFSISRAAGYNESLDFWRSILGRAGLNSSEERFLYHFFNKIEHIDVAHYQDPKQD